mgnify:CR=1 FL=1
MDDYDHTIVSEAQREWSSRLITIITPQLIEGIKSIFDEAWALCIDNEEDNKYLMTFQNLLSRVPKWNDNIIDTESQRIVNLTKCKYLEDILTCVHITQLKILTSVRVSQKQKKIDLDIPKLPQFIHKVYITLARKIYSNVYLFEKNIQPLLYQKNMREVEILTRESILEVIRENMPIESILRSYIDETIEEEVIEEVVEKEVEEKEKEETEPEDEDNTKVVIEKSNDDENTVKETTTNTDDKEDKITDPIVKVETETVDNVETVTTEPLQETVSQEVSEEIENKKLSFNDNDAVLDMGTNEETVVNAPKNVERLDKISKENHERRKLEEEEEEDDDDEDRLVIGETVNLDSDILTLDKNLDKKNDLALDDIELLT